MILVLRARGIQTVSYTHQTIVLGMMRISELSEDEVEALVEAALSIIDKAVNLRRCIRSRHQCATNLQSMRLYLVDFNRAELDTCLITNTNMGWLWHRRLAHVRMKNLHKLLKGEHILGLTNG